jgi:golgi SNAP receptor complex member 1
LAQRLHAQDKSLDTLLQTAENGSLVPTEEEATLRNDIQRTSLSDLLQTKLAPAAERSGKSQHQLLVKRYREILFDLTGDFSKTSALLARRKEQLELFSNHHNSGTNSASSADEGMQHLMRERNHIHNSLSASSAVLNQASEIHSDLRAQGMSLRGVQGTVLRITSNIPGLNRLVENIRRRRSRDDMILSGVIAACILFTLWYVFG